MYALPILYLCVSYLSANKQRLVPFTSKLIGFITEMKSVYSAVRTVSLNEAVCVPFLNVKLICLSLYAPKLNISNWAQYKK
jgi:hypothetical protein